MSRAPSRNDAASRLQARTPHLVAPRLDETNLTYKPSLRPWVRLQYQPPGTQFLIGRAVQIVDVQNIAHSPTTYPDQPNVWTRSDHDSLYRFEKRVKKITYERVEVPERVPHRKLRPANDPRGQAGSTVYSCGEQDLYICTEQIKLQYGIQELIANSGTNMMLAEMVSARGYAATTKVNTESMWYRVVLFVKKEEWEWVRAIPAEEVQQLKKRALERPQIISVNKLPGGAKLTTSFTRTQDDHE
ncbi:hypothetical protein C8Q74DRAFT_1217358 [Fomes fomentarius]|nr:hypothetical protein C8Q74DRAFT_1217358 [Fomes fomentarius]